MQRRISGKGKLTIAELTKALKAGEEDEYVFASSSAPSGDRGPNFDAPAEEWTWYVLIGEDEKPEPKNNSWIGIPVRELAHLVESIETVLKNSSAKRLRYHDVDWIKNDKDLKFVQRHVNEQVDSTLLFNTTYDNGTITVEW